MMISNKISSITEDKRGLKHKEEMKAVEDTPTRVLDRMIEGNIDASTSEEQIIDSQTSLAKTRVRFSEALREHYQYDTSIKRGQNYLLKHVSSKMPLVIIYIDIVESTNLSMTLPAEKLVTIIRAFSHEMSAVTKSYNGYVLKYVGDAIIVFFPSGFNKYLTYDNAVRCARSMMKVLKNGINPVLNSDDFAQLRIKIGMAEGENVVVQYGYDRSSQIDLIGYGMNMAAKITSLTAPNKISVGENIYEMLHPKIQSDFEELTNLYQDGWKYINHKTGKVYKVYTLK
jgi:adenylate cyclase